MKTNIQLLDCKVCKAKESVIYQVKENETFVEVKVTKCNNCKHQHGIKELCQN